MSIRQKFSRDSEHCGIKMGIIPPKSRLILAEELGTGYCGRSSFFCWCQGSSLGTILKPSLLQRERESIVISGTDVTHCNQSLLFEGPFLGFFCLCLFLFCYCNVSHMFISLWCLYHSPRLFKMRIYFAWTCVSLWGLWNLNAVDSTTWKFIVVRASLHSELIARSPYN